MKMGNGEERRNGGYEIKEKSEKREGEKKE